MEARHFIKTLCKQKVNIFLSTFMELDVKWVPYLIVLKNEG